MREIKSAENLVADVEGDIEEVDGVLWLLDAVDGGPPPISSGDTATKALEAAVGLHCSSRLGGEWVDFPDGLDRELVVPSL